MQQPDEILSFEHPFDEQLLEVLVLFGASGFGGGKIPKERHWTASVELAGWKTPGGPLHTEPYHLVCKAPDEILHALQGYPPYSLLRTTVRQDGRRLLLCQPLEPVQDAQLEALRTQLQTPVLREQPPFGCFTLDRSVSTFTAPTRWLDTPVNLSFDEDDEPQMQASLATGAALWAEQAAWDARLRAYAVTELLSLKNDNWLEEDESPLTEADFSACLTLREIDLAPEGAFGFWFDDGDLFWGHSIHLTGTLEGGLDQAGIEG